MKAKFGSPVKTENLFDGGLYMLGAAERSFPGLALSRAKCEFVLSLSPAPGAARAPGLVPLADLHPVAVNLSELAYALVLDPADVALDQEAIPAPGEVTVIGDRSYLCYAGEDGAPGYVTFGTGQVQKKLPAGPRNCYKAWRLERETLDGIEVLARYPYRAAELEVLPAPEERRKTTIPVLIDRRRANARLRIASGWRGQRFPVPPAVPGKSAAD